MKLPLKLWVKCVRLNKVCYSSCSRKKREIPELNPCHIGLVLGALWAAIEIRIAYKSFTHEEKARMGNFKFPCLVGIRTIKNMLSRPGQVISIPAKAMASVEAKLLALN